MKMLKEERSLFRKDLQAYSTDVTFVLPTLLPRIDLAFLKVILPYLAKGLQTDCNFVILKICGAVVNAIKLFSSEF